MNGGALNIKDCVKVSLDLVTIQDFKANDGGGIYISASDTLKESSLGNRDAVKTKMFLTNDVVTENQSE